MTAKPIIGINADYRSAHQKQPAFSAVTSGYYDRLQKAGAICMVVPPAESEEDTQAILDLLDGFLVAGGADLDPRRDGFMLHPTTRPMDGRRESFDRMLMRLVTQRRMPVFGIGVGMQLLNVTRGGNLFLHLPEDVPEALPHKDNQDPHHRHGLEVVPGSVMDRVYGDGEIRVSSRHHMAIDEVAADFQVTARCPDGIVEAIESADPAWFAMGVQFHPESEAASALDLRLFREFVEAIGSPNPALELQAVA